jgi:hypothetical protein
MNSCRVRATWAFCVVCSIGVALSAQAALITESLEYNFRGKQWCPSQSNPGRGEFDNFNEVNKDFNKTVVTIVRDPENTDDITKLQVQLSTPNPAQNFTFPQDFLSLTMVGRGFLANKSGNKAEFVVNGVSGTDSKVFFTMRGQAILDPKNLVNGVPAIKKASGKFIAEYSDDSNGPLIHCFGAGTFVTGKKAP